MKVAKVIIIAFFSIIVVGVVYISIMAAHAKKNEPTYSEIREYQINKAEEIRKKQMENLKNDYILESFDTLGISNELSDFEIIVEKDIYKFPLQINSFLDKGWNIEENTVRERVLAPEETIMSIKIEKDDKSFYLRIKNNTEEDINALKADIFQITFYSVIPEIKGDILHPDIRLSQGIRLGSLKDQLIDAYGEPDDIREETLQNDVIFLNYKYVIDDRSNYKIVVDKYSSVITEIEITNRN